MDVLNDNDEDNNMDNDSFNSDNNSNNEEEDNIDHNRLRELANYADQNRDTPQEGPYSLSELPELDREEMRVGETKMVSYQESDRYEGTGINLHWGEYYVPDPRSGDSDGDESSLSSCEEAEEINDEEIKWREPSCCYC